MATYMFAQAPTAEQRRLDALAELYDEGTIRHVVERGIGAGARCWEVGAGSGTIALWLSERAGPGGSVLATDLDTRFLDRWVGGNLDIRRHDVVAEPPPEGPFDIIHARALVEHLPDRAGVVAKLASVLAPGGWLLLEDVVMMPPASAPAAPVVERVVAAFTAGFRLAGAEPNYGLQLPADLEAAGLRHVGRHARIPVVSSATPSADFHLLSLEHLREAFVAAELLTDDEVDEALALMRTPGTTVLGPVMVAAWGQRPA